MAERKELVGPSGMSEADLRLAALRAHLSALAERQEPKKEPSLAEALIPLILAQSLDMLSTEKPLGFNRRLDMGEVTNPLPGSKAPGFAGTLGRLGAGGAELLLASLLYKVDPKLGRAYMVPSMSSHMELSKRNMADLNERNSRDLWTRR